MDFFHIKKSYSYNLIGEIMIVIDAYRGGNDIGYTGNGIIEKDFNLEISKYMNGRLNELGINTYLTRDTDTDLNINQRSSLIKDAFGNNKGVIAISNRLAVFYEFIVIIHI